MSEINAEDKLTYVKSKIGDYPDFPKPGILFRDIFGALTDAKACVYLRDLLVEHVRHNHPDVEIIVGLDSRGFLFNLLLATELGISCAPIRKKGKLPGEVASVEYQLEYGSDTFEIQLNAIKPGQKVVIVDDLLATGGSLVAATQLVRKVGGAILECLVVMELSDLKGRAKIDSKVHSLFEY
ncbi:adenine phosphoribosyltransferase [Drosophila tropicalis]|uniref:adenine phosphoribosyltransferase n=1 Tax=Drosophila tropicalis TaxID=46794 RepID=UPI0035ABFCF1